MKHRHRAVPGAQVRGFQARHCATPPYTAMTSGALSTSATVPSASTEPRASTVTRFRDGADEGHVVLDDQDGQAIVAVKL